ncbi:MAG: DegT/DnrJ/EryC1/StrS family aminotransferase [Lachnospiraceae bacterium]|nr:DegT/DnrJ/EryC1/StrS family aminotransferase [Lachnospiraceae bacterium]
MNNNKKKNKEEKILVTRSSMPSIEEYMEELRSVWDSRYLTNMGVKHEELKEALKAYLKVDNIELFTNGHNAIELSLQAFALKGEVITTPFTFASTTHAIVRCGLKPVFCDINPKDYTMDPGRIRELITDRTCAILPVHVYGNICRVDEIDRIAKEYGLKVIYDAAHAFGESLDGRGIGTFGDASCYSFHATKVFHTIEGGAVCFGNREKAFGEMLYLLKDFGISRENNVEAVGTNAKLNEFCAVMGLCNLRHIAEEIARRKKVSERYDRNLQGIPGLTLRKAQPGLTMNYGYYPILFNKEIFGLSRDEAAEILSANGIFARKYFYPTTNAFDCYRGIFDPAETPVAKQISEQVLTLPLFADLPLEEVDRICSIIINRG